MVLECCKQSLKNLKIDYIDLYLIHWPTGFQEGQKLFPLDKDGNLIFSSVDYVETWHGMEDCFERGLAKSIGLSNFNSQQIQRVLNACKVKPVVNQIECHPYLNQSKMIDFCKSHGILVTAYSPLGSADRLFASANDPILMSDKTLKSIAEKHGKSVAQILIRYQVQRGIVVIPKSVTPSRILSNIDVFDFELTEDDMSKINNLNRDFRYITNEAFKQHIHYPFKGGEF
ncbi:aldose reductase-like protein [Leptotrombidium deliense]|uniref:Aldose reductase-like protein n=1 Tax=Leptotrombidium deliense TaxID=299467 RepID=A0A443S2K5_9ACAR|nr:aldose reductase-like protein [Leptotrombidium deliense]